MENMCKRVWEKREEDSNEKVSEQSKRKSCSLNVAEALNAEVAATPASPATIKEAHGQQMKGGKECIDS